MMADSKYVQLRNPITKVWSKISLKSGRIVKRSKKRFRGIPEKRVLMPVPNSQLPNLSEGYKKGDRVKILRQDIAGLKHRPDRNGVVTSVNGAYIMVRPMWCTWEIELYPCEIERLKT